MPDSVAIMRHLEDRGAALFGPPEVDLFIEWFNEVWKVPPNAIEAEHRPGADRRLAARMDGWLDLFERLLAERDYLLTDRLSAADFVAYPFLKYAAGRDPADDELFHRVLDEHQICRRPPAAGGVDRADRVATAGLGAP